MEINNFSKDKVCIPLTNFNKIENDDLRLSLRKKGTVGRWSESPSIVWTSIEFNVKDLTDEELDILKSSDKIHFYCYGGFCIY